MTAQGDKLGATAAFAAALLSIAALAVGMSIVAASGGPGGATSFDPSQAQSPRVLPLLLLAEIVKVAIAAVSLVLVVATRQRLAAAPRLAAVATGAGIAGAALILASGTVGYHGAMQPVGATPMLGGDGGTFALAVGAVATGLGLASLFASGGWALLTGVAGLRTGSIGRLPAYAGIVHGVAALVTFAFPPLALLVFAVGLVWLVSLGMALRRPA